MNVLHFKFLQEILEDGTLKIFQMKMFQTTRKSALGTSCSHGKFDLIFHWVEFTQFALTVLEHILVVHQPAREETLGY